jgi:hypothetical protein
MRTKYLVFLIPIGVIVTVLVIYLVVGALAGGGGTG